jgi:hypothetical protein
MALANMASQTKDMFVIISLALSFCSYLPHFYGLYKKRVKPHVFTWFVWGLIMGIAFFMQDIEGAGKGGWITAWMSLASFIICILSIKSGEKNIAKSDWATLITALVTIPLWLLTKHPLYSVILLMTIDTLGFWPTIRKTWLRPYQEAVSPYGIAIIACSFSILAMEQVNAVTIFVPATVCIVNGLFVIMAMYRRYLLRLA